MCVYVPVFSTFCVNTRNLCRVLSQTCQLALRHTVMNISQAEKDVSHGSHSAKMSEKPRSSLIKRNIYHMSCCRCFFLLVRYKEGNVSTIIRSVTFYFFTDICGPQIMCTADFVFWKENTKIYLLWWRICWLDDDTSARDINSNSSPTLKQMIQPYRLFLLSMRS